MLRSLVWCLSLLAGPVIGLSVSSLLAAEPFHRSELLFPLNDKHNHAPGIAELKNGELVASWYRGSGERTADDVQVLGSRLKPGAKEWTPAAVWHDTAEFPDCNTCLHVNDKGELWLYWPIIIANTWESALTQYLVAEHPEGDGAPKWTRQGTILLKPDDFSEQGNKDLDALLAKSPPISDSLKRAIGIAREKMSDKLFQRLGWQPRCKPTVLPSGRILLPLYSDTFSFSIMAISDDQGKTWFASQPIMGFGAIQPSVLRRNDGTLVAFMRENGASGKIRLSESKDDGLTWSAVTSSTLPNPGSGLDAVRLANGHWVLIYNDLEKGRNHLAVSISTDEGQTWGFTRHLEKKTEGRYHYPAIIQAKDGTIHAVYSYFVDGGKSMKHAAFNEEWVQQGDGN